MAENVIRGGTTFTFIDQLLANWGGAKYQFLVLAIVIFPFNFLTGWDGLSTWVSALSYAMASIVVTAGCLLAGYLALVAYIAVLRMRANKGQLVVSYELNYTDIVVRDAGGTAITMPWSNLRGASESRYAFRVLRKPWGQIYIPKRSFTTSEIFEVRELMREKLAVKAKLKK
jgi:hypothetical protein